MDLLDMELDLGVEPTSSRITRRSQAATSVTSQTPKTLGRKKQTTTPAKIESSTASAAKNPVKEEEIVHSKPESFRTPKRSPRSPSTEKREKRNKAKKRFSPSPVTKKRKSILTPRPAVSNDATSIPARKIKIASQAEFTESLNQFKVALEGRGITDFDIPEDWKTPTPSDTVNQIITELSGTLPNISDSSSAAAPPPDTMKPGRKSLPKKNRASNITEKMPTTSTEAQSSSSKNQDRCRSFSQELGVDDEPEEQQAPVATPKQTKKAQKTAKTTEEVKSPRKSARKSELKKPEPEEKAKEPRKSASKRKSSSLMNKDEPSTSTEAPSADVPGTSEASDEASEIQEAPENPNSALAIKKRLMGGGESSKSAPTKNPPKARKSNVKKPEKEAEALAPPEPPAEPQEAAETPAPEPLVPEKKPKIEDAPTTSSPKKSTPTSAPPTRASARVSKPNRLYADGSFNTEILGRTRITEQNPVKEAQAKESTPELADLPLPAGRRKSTAAPRAPPAPKPIPVINGVLRGYIPSVKVPLAEYEVDGEIINLNEGVNETMDTILAKVCEDGVEKHEDIDPKVVKAKKLAKIDYTKRLKLQVKKLDIQMRIKIPSTPEELGKRKRQAPKTDDFYWSAQSRTKLKGSSKEREETPAFDEESPIGGDEKRQQKARESISHLFDAEMDASIKEAKKYSVSFDKYIKPKITGALKHAKIKLMSRKRQSAEPDDFYYHELLVDQVSPSNSNVENVDVDVDIEETDDKVDPTEFEISEEGVIGIRDEAVDMAEQIALVIPRPTKHDGSPMSMDEIQMRAMEHVESRTKCLDGSLEIVLNQLGHEMAPPTRGVEEQGCQWHTVTSANAQALKNLYTIANNCTEDAITWTHQFMIENLEVHMLASYLSILKYAKRLNSSRFGYVISSTDQLDPEWTQVTSLLKSFVYKRHTEPGTEVLNNTIPYHRMTDTVFLLVPPTLTFGDHQRAPPRHHARIFRWLQSIGHQDSEFISFDEDIDATCSVAEYLSDVIVERICDKVRQKNKYRPNCNVVLVGYGASTYLIHRAANLVEGISAIISIGFPVMTSLGRRGTADDEILLTYCPTLFIVGAEGRRFNNEAITELRTSMISPSGLVVVGHSNDMILVPTSMLLRLGISQTVVFRMVLEKILDFLNLEPVRQQEFADLVPIELNNVFDLDSALLKSDKALSGLAFASSTHSASSSAAPSPVGASGRRATVTGAGSEDIAKRRKESIILSQQIAAPSISGPPPPAPSPRTEDRFLAFQNLVASTITTGDDMPRRASMGASPRVIERGDFRDHRPPPPPPLPILQNPVATPMSQQPPLPSPAPPPPRGPVDPASISLI